MGQYKNHIPRGAPQRPGNQDPRRPLPDEIPPGRVRNFVLVGLGIGIFVLGALFGIFLSPEPDSALTKQLSETNAALQLARSRLIELERAITYKTSNSSNGQALLNPEQKKLIEIGGKNYAKALRQARHQSASDLVYWFVDRWVSLLNQSTANDRSTKRAELLAQFVGAMAKNLNPGDYVGWQVELFQQPWLAEVSSDFDGDGYPTKVGNKNPRDGFTQASICKIAMALNQTATNAFVILMPTLQCDSPKSQISLFLGGKTIRSALDEFVQTLKAKGFAVVDKTISGKRQILIGP